MPRIHIIGLILGLHLLLDGNEVQVDANGDVVVAPGVHHWAVIDAQDEEVASGDVTVDACTTSEPTPTPTPTATPTGGVGGETFTPTNTPPPTDALDSTGNTPGGDSWRLVFLAMAGVLAAVLLLTPAESLTRRGKKDR